MAQKPDIIQGAWDIHVHAAPSIFSRWGDAYDLARECGAAGMAGFVLKAHHGSTIESAKMLQKKHPAMRVYGGVVLNAFVGGINPHAVDAALALGGRVVWLPTIHAAFHKTAFGVLGEFPFQKPMTRFVPKQGIRICDDNGTLVESMREILDRMNKSGAVLGTGHISPDEILALSRTIRAERYDIRLLINHALFTVPALTKKHIEMLANDRTWFEICHLSVSSHVNAATPAHVASVIRSFPQAQWVVASDSGQKENIHSPDALRTYAEVLRTEGVSDDMLFRMTHDAPRDLLRRT